MPEGCAGHIRLRLAGNSGFTIVLMHAAVGEQISALISSEAGLALVVTDKSRIDAKSANCDEAQGPGKVQIEPAF